MRPVHIFPSPPLLSVPSLNSRAAPPFSMTRALVSFSLHVLAPSLPPALFVFSSLSRRNRRRSSGRPNSLLYACTNGIDRNPSYRRIAADTHAPRGHPAGTPCVVLVRIQGVPSLAPRVSCYERTVSTRIVVGSREILDPRLRAQLNMHLGVFLIGRRKREITPGILSHVPR